MKKEKNKKAKKNKNGLPLLLNVVIIMLCAPLIGAVIFCLLVQFAIDDVSLKELTAENVTKLIPAVISIMTLVTGGGAAVIAYRLQKKHESDSVSNRFIKAIDHIGHLERSVRQGAVYEFKELSEIVSDDHVRDIISILSRFARDTMERKSREVETEIEKRYKARLDESMNIEDGEKIRKKIIEQYRTTIDTTIDAKLDSDTLTALYILDYICDRHEKLWIKPPIKAGNAPYVEEFDLSYAHLDYLNLERINFRYAKLGHVNMNWVHFECGHQSLNKKDLWCAHLWGADLTGADLESVDLADVDLMYADLTDAYLTDAYLARADLARANLTNANLANANLARANLTNANLANANLANVSLAFANLMKANLMGAHLTSADLRDAYLTDAWLLLDDLQNTNLDPDELKSLGAIIFNTLEEYEEYSRTGKLPVESPDEVPV